MTAAFNLIRNHAGRAALLTVAALALGIVTTVPGVLLGQLAGVPAAYAAARPMIPGGTGNARTCHAYTQWRNRSSNGAVYRPGYVAKMGRRSQSADDAIQADVFDLDWLAPLMAVTIPDPAQRGHSLALIRVASAQVAQDCQTG